MSTLTKTRVNGGAVLVLSGLAGVGKTTIATEIHRLLNFGHSEPPELYANNSLLFHNHLVIDYAKALISRALAAQSHMELRESILDRAIEIMKDNPDEDRVFIITAHALMGVDGQYLRSREMQKYIDLAKARNVPFVWVHLSCQADEHKRRIEHPARRATKIKNYEDLLENIGKEYEGQLEGFKGLDQHHGLTSFTRLDTTSKTAEETALLIVQLLGKPMPLANTETICAQS